MMMIIDESSSRACCLRMRCAFSAYFLIRRSKVAPVRTFFSLWSSCTASCSRQASGMSACNRVVFPLVKGCMQTTLPLQLTQDVAVNYLLFFVFFLGMAVSRPKHTIIAHLRGSSKDCCSIYNFKKQSKSGVNYLLLLLVLRQTCLDWSATEAVPRTYGPWPGGL